MKAVDGEIIGIWDGFAYIIYDNVGKTICKVAMGDETDTFLSLNDCIKLIDYDKNKTKGCIIVILDDCLSGKVYRYNNYGDSTWYECGSTEGYA